MKPHWKFFGALILALAVGRATATTFYVNVSNTVPLAPYTNWPTAATNIQDAVDAATNGDTVLVTNGVYNTGGRVAFGTMTNRVVADKALAIQSVNGVASTIIVGARNANVPPSGVRCIYLTNGASLIGFTLTNGATRASGDTVLEQSGGGVWCADSSSMISNCVFAGNSAAYYGGGSFQGTFRNCTFTNNSASYGGGVASNTLFGCVLIRNSSLYQNINYGGGAYGCALSNCLMVGNQSVAGGGFGGGAAFSVLTTCVASNNVAGASGGGLYFGVANNSLISSNRAASGGGGACASILDNCTLQNNNGINAGGGAYLGTLNNCILTNNTANSGAGACSNVLFNCILQNNVATAAGGGAYQCTLNNCTLVGNGANLGGGAYQATLNNCIAYYNIVGAGNNYFGGALSYCDTTPLPNGLGNFTNAPGFVNLTNNFHLQSNSPCINAGKNSFVTTTNDLDGNPRIVGGTVDIGCYEFQSPSSVLSYAWAQQYNLPTDGSADFIDSDGDGMNNWQEWIAGVIPTNAASVLLMNSPSNAAPGLKVSWQSVNTRTYFLQRSTNLPAFTALQSNLTGGSVTTTFTDTSATNGGPYFYRVGVQ